MVTSILNFLNGTRPSPRKQPAVVADSGILDTPLLWFGENDPWTIRAATEGTAIYGSSGSGKTTGSGAAIAKAFLSAGFGGIVLTCKPNERALWESYCRETHRSSDLIVFAPTGPWRFNFLDFESRAGVGTGLTENLVRVFTTVMEVAERTRGQGNAQDFWERTTKQLLRNCIDLLLIGKGRLLLHEVYDVLVSAPSSPEELASEAWQNSSFCMQCIRAAEGSPKTQHQENDFAMTTKYFLREFPNLSSRTRSIICTSLTSMLDLFLRGALRELFCTTTNFVPELTHEGAIVIVDLPIKEFGEVGRVAQTLLKFIWQRATERRDTNKHPLPVFMFCDEAHFFSTSYDAIFQSTARSARVATVYLSQNIGAYYAEIGESETHMLMGNLQTKIFHANGDTITNNWAADLFSKSWQFRSSAGTSTSGGPFSPQNVSRNFGTTDSLDHEVLPGTFTMLRKGSPEHDWCVDGICFQGGRIWHETGKNHITVGFAQR